jgi:hypothetical protein
MDVKCSICGDKAIVKEGRSLCINCSDAIRRLVWIDEGKLLCNQHAASSEEAESAGNAQPAPPIPPASSGGFWGWLGLTLSAYLRQPKEAEKIRTSTARSGIVSGILP